MVRGKQKDKLSLWRPAKKPNGLTVSLLLKGMEIGMINDIN